MTLSTTTLKILGDRGSHCVTHRHPLKGRPKYPLALGKIFSPDFSFLSTVLFYFVWVILTPYLSFYVSLRGYMIDPFLTSSTFGCSRTEACSSLILWTSSFQFHFYRDPTSDQLKLTKSSLPFWLYNRFKLLIILPKIEALLVEG